MPGAIICQDVDEKRLTLQLTLQLNPSTHSPIQISQSSDCLLP